MKSSLGIRDVLMTPACSKGHAGFLAKRWVDMGLPATSNVTLSLSRDGHVAGIAVKSPVEHPQRLSYTATQAK